MVSTAPDWCATNANSDLFVERCKNTLSYVGEEMDSRRSLEVSPSKKRDGSVK